MCGGDAECYRISLTIVIIYLSYFGDSYNDNEVELNNGKIKL